MKLDTRLRAGEVITDREKFLLGVIRYMDDQDPWYLGEDPETCNILARDFGYERGLEER